MASSEAGRNGAARGRSFRPLNPAPRSVRPRPAHLAAVAAALVVLTLAAYAGVLSCGFVNYDDDVYVTDNPRVLKGLGAESIPWAFSTTAAANWHPLTWLSHMLDVRLFGLDAGKHHRTSLLLHALNTVLLFLLLAWMTGALWRPAFVAGLFAVHPLHVESVAWVAERKDVLSALFWLLTLVAWLWYLSSKRPFHLALAVVLFGLGLMAKPMLVTLPFTLLLLDWWPLGRLGTTAAERRHAPALAVERGEVRPGNAGARAGAARQGSAVAKTVAALGAPPSGAGAEGRTERGRLRIDAQAIARGLVPLAWETLPFLLLAALSCVVTFAAQQSGRAVQSLVDFTFAERVANALLACSAYLGRVFWPASLAVFYPHTHPAFLSWKVAGSALLLVAITYLSIRLARKAAYLTFGWFWYLGTLLPVIGLVQVGSQASADRYTYVTLIGPFVAIAWGLAELAKRGRPFFYAVVAACAGSIIALVLLTRIQVGYWTNSAALFDHALAVTSDSWLAHNNLGRALVEQGKTADAAAHFTEALRIRPDYDGAHLNLGNILAGDGKLEEAIDHYRAALAANPSFAEARTNLGLALARQGRTEDAIEQYEEALRASPGSAKTHNALGVALVRQGRVDEAIEQYRLAQRDRPDDFDAANNMGLACARIGRIPEAIASFQQALRVRPASAEAHNNLGVALANANRMAEARGQFEQAVRLDPSYDEARANLSRADQALGANR